jgi:carbamoyltransferase
VIGYRFIPGLVARVRHEGGGYLVRCNRVGFRCDREATERKSQKMFRALVFGDSFTAGDGVSNGKRYSDLLESRFLAAEILNFGLPGSGTDQQFLVFSEYASQLDYDLMIISPTVANIWRIIVDEQVTMGATDGLLVKRPKPSFRLDRRQLQLENQPVPREVRLFDPAELEQNGKEVDGLKRFVRGIYTRWPELHGLALRLRRIRSPAEYDDPDSDAWQLMKAILVEWIRRSRARVLLCPIPGFLHVNKYVASDGYLRRFTELGAEEGVEVVDVLPGFWGLTAADRKRCRFPTDEHPTEFGHEVLANALYPHVRKYYDEWKATHA